MIKVGSKEVIPNRLSKVTKGYILIWEKSTDKTVSWTTSSQISPFTKYIDIPVSYQSELKDKQLLSVKIGELQEVSQDIKIVFMTNDSFTPYISFSKSFDELLGISDWIPAGAKITVTYK